MNFVDTIDYPPVANRSFRRGRDWNALKPNSETSRTPQAN